VTRKKDNAKPRITAEDLKQILAEDRDLLKVIVEEVLQQVLEAEMDEALQASKGERTVNRLGYRSGYYSRTLVTRVGRSPCACRRTGKSASERKYSSAISAAKKR
jgi:transposase-like protein